MATNVGLKWAKSADSPLFVTLAFLNRVEYHITDFKGFICDDLATLSKNLIYFDPVTPEFNRVKGVHLLVDQLFCYAAPLLALQGSVLSFFSFLGRSLLSFASVIL